MALKPEQIKYLKSLYLEGITQRKMQDITGYSIRTISNYCQEFKEEVEVEKKEIVIKHAALTGEIIGQSQTVPQMSEETIDLIEARIQEEMKNPKELNPAVALLARSFMEFITKMSKI